MGAGSRLVTFEEAEDLGQPVVGYLAYDQIAKLEPTVPLPTDGHGFPESRFVVADTLVRFDHGAGTAEVLAGDAEEVAGRLEAGIPWHREATGASEPLRRFPERRALRGDGADREGAHRRRATCSSACPRSAPSGRPPPRRSTSTAPSAASTRPRTSSSSTSTGSRSSARRPSGSSRARTAARASARSPGRPSRPRATSSGCSRRRRTAPST